MSTLRRLVGTWVAAAAVFVVALGLLALAHVPAPVLIAAAIAGCTCALVSRRPPSLPEHARSVGLAIVAVAAGSHVDGDVVDVLLDNPLVVFAAVAGTLGLSLAAGQLLRLSGRVSMQTALLASVAGGASGAAAIARELDADEAMVLALQYLRVLVVLGTLPIMATLLGAQPSAGATNEPWSGWGGLWFTVLAVAVGLLLTRIVRFSGNRMLLPLAVACVLALTGWFHNTQVPEVVLGLGNAVIGLMVGLSFTRAALRRLSGVLPLAIIQVVTSIAGAAVFGAVLANVAHVSAVDGYLATTPGGLPTVTGIAVGADVDVGFVVTAQVLRMVMAMVLAVLLGTQISRRRHGRRVA
jgi:membrane AbrB-like protein